MVEVIVLMGGSGGVGASCLAAAVALRSAEQRRTLLIDADPTGPGMDLLWAAEEAPGVRWPDLAGAKGLIELEPLTVSAVHRRRVNLLSGGRTGGATARAAAGVADGIVDAGQDGMPLRVVVDGGRMSSVLGVGAVDPFLRVADAVVAVVGHHVHQWHAAAMALPDVSAGTSRSCRIAAVVRGSVGRAYAQRCAAELGLPLAARLRDDPGVDRALAAAVVPGARGGRLRRCATAIDDWMTGAP